MNGYYALSVDVGEGAGMVHVGGSVVDVGVDLGAVWCRQGKCRIAIAAAAVVSVKGLNWWALTVTPGPFSSSKEMIGLSGQRM